MRVTLISMVCATLLVACKPEPQAEPAPATLDEVPQGTGVESLGMTMGYVTSDKYTYWLHQAGTDFTKPCTITSTDIASADYTKKDISCIIDAKELDLYYWGLTLKYNVPASMCSYVVWDPYYFYAFEPFDGPDYVSYSINGNGEMIGLEVKRGGAGGTDATADVLVDGTTITCAKGNYELAGIGPDCCIGSYSLRTRAWDASVDADNDGTPEGAWGGWATTTAFWSGEAANCLKGPAMDKNPGFLANGFPMAEIKYVEGEGWASEYEVASPMSLHAGTNVYVANYFNAAEHNNRAPAPLRAPANANAPAPQPYYELLCLNRAFELNARVRLMIRDWNEVAEWDKKGSGNPDTTGNEANYATPINDFWDWRDLRTVNGVGAWLADVYPFGY